MVDAFILAIVVLAAKGAFRAFLTADGILFRAQLLPPLRLSFDCFFIGHIERYLQLKVIEKFDDSVIELLWLIDIDKMA